MSAVRHGESWGETLRACVDLLGEACGYALAFIFTAVFVGSVPALIGVAIWRSLP